jgi:hypothetical protein
MVRPEPTIKSMVAISLVMLVSLGFMENCTQWQESKPGMIHDWEKQLPAPPSLGARAPSSLHDPRLHDALRAELDPREVWLHCRRRDEPETCYSKRVGVAFDRVADPYFVGKKEQEDEERTQYLMTYSFSEVGKNTENFLKGVFAPSLSSIREVARKRVESCKKGSPSDALQACVDEAAFADVSLVRDQFAKSKGLEISDREAAILLRDMLWVAYQEAVKEK